MTNVLFVCIGNAGRSQMAQAFYERRGGTARSRGSDPSPELHANVVDALDEIGIDISNREPAKLAQEDVEWADVVVTMGCGDACPVLPGKRYMDWNLRDPIDMPLEDVRRLRDEIARLVEQLPD